ncbi:MAG: serine/threonine protein kinase, partial [Candidatus Riflebacteria bacterium]|nr:serine/threonine protein kinase [Candidatus Riflebacteria bacterium]
IQGPDGTLYVKVPPGFAATTKPIYSLDEQRAIRRSLINVYLQEGLLDRALFHLTQYQPRDAAERNVIFTQRGLALAKKGELELAQKELDRVSLDEMGSPSPTDLALLYQVALVYLHCCRPPRALASLKRILLFDVGYRDSAALVERLRQTHTQDAPRTPDLDQTRVLGTLPAVKGEPTPAGARLVGRYQLGERLRSGFIGDLFKGRDPALERQLVLRRLSGPIARDKITRERFVTTARQASSLAHPNLVPILDIVETGEGDVWFVTEWAPGVDAVRMVAGGKPVNPGLVALLGLQASSALAFAHENRVLHRDLKSSDFLIDSETRTIRVLDFGLSGVSNTLEVAPEEYLQRRCDFMPPEFIRGERVDEQGDVYSLGMLLYLLSCGRFPFDERDLHGRMFMYMETPIPPPRQVAPSVPARLEQVVMACLKRKKEARFGSAKALWEALGKLRGDL